MSKQIKIRPSPMLEEYISRFASPTVGANQLYSRYLLMQNSIKEIELDEDEKQIIHAMLHGVEMTDFIINCSALIEDIHDDEYADMTGMKTLAEKLSKSNLSEIVVTVEKLGY